MFPSGSMMEWSVAFRINSVEHSCYAAINVRSKIQNVLDYITKASSTSIMKRNCSFFIFAFQASLTFQQ